jgi:hypothetical protein
MAEVAQNIVDLCSEMIILQKQINDLEESLIAKKEEIRLYAAGATLEIPVSGSGKVTVAKPKEASRKETIVLDEAELRNHQELMKTLYDQKIISSRIVAVKAAKAQVTIKVNV